MLLNSRSARHIADNGRILYVGSSTTVFATPGHGLYSGSKIAAQFLVEVCEGDRQPRRHRQLDPADCDRGRGCLHLRGERGGDAVRALVPAHQANGDAG